MNQGINFWNIVIDINTLNINEASKAAPIILLALDEINNSPNDKFYSARLNFLRKIDAFFETKLFYELPHESGETKVAENYSLRDNQHYSTEKYLFDAPSADIEKSLRQDLRLVRSYLDHLDHDFDELLRSSFKFKSIYKSEISDFRQVADHEIYFKNPLEINSKHTTIPAEFEGKLLTFLIAAKGRNNRTNIAIKGILEACGDYIKYVEIIVSEDASDDLFANETGAEVTHLVANILKFSGIWNKSALLNEGLRRAQANYVVMSDCDFLYSDLRGLIETAFDNIDESNYMFHFPLHETHQTQFIENGVVKNRGKFYPYSYVWVFNKNRALEIGGFNEEFVGWGYEETDLIRRVLSNGSILGYLDNIRSYHFSHHDSTRIRGENNKNIFDKNILIPTVATGWEYDTLDPKAAHLISYYYKERNNCIDILGNGPALKGYDFFKNSVKIGFNAAYRYWRRVDVYPDIYVCMDKVVCAYHASSIKELIDSGRSKFFILDDVFTEIHPEYESCLNVITYSTLRSSFRIFETKHITTGSFGARLAILLGFRSLNLWGMSGEYMNFLPESERISLADSGLPIKSIYTSSKSTGEILRITKTPRNNPNYFFDDYQIEGDLYNIPTTSTSYKCQCEFHAGRVVDSSIHEYWLDLLLFDLQGYSSQLHEV